MNFATRLKQLRENKDLKQKELADLLHLQQSTISAYERDKIQPTPETINILADFFGVTSDYLLGRQDTSKTKLEQTVNSTIEELKQENTLLFLKDDDFDEETARLIKIAMKNAMRTVDDMKKKDWYLLTVSI